MENTTLKLEHTYLPEIMLAHPIDLSVPLSLEECVHRLTHQPESQAGGMRIYISPVSQTSMRFQVDKRIARFFEVEATGYLIRRRDNATIVVGQSRISPHTYAMTLLLAVLAVVFSHSLFALLFGLLCLRMVMAIVVSGSVCKAEVASYIENSLQQPPPFPENSP